MDNERIYTGDIVQHFKRETLSPEDRNANKYLYKVLGVATHSETKEKYVVYQGLYDGFEMYIRPYDMRVSVSHAAIMLA